MTIMTYPLFSPAFAEPISISAGKFPASIQAFQKDLQTGLVDVDFQHQPHHQLLFVGGKLVNVYAFGDGIKRIDPEIWLESFNGTSPAASLRALALPTQAVRIIKILIEQRDDTRFITPPGLSIEEQFVAWKNHAVPALAHIRWPSADGLALFPGKGGLPSYTLFVAADQILHSAGSMMAFFGWKETCDSAVLFSSEPLTPAWTEYLLHNAFSSLVSYLLERFEELTGRILLNQIIRDINFTSAAHGWNVSINSTNITDQAIFSSPQAAAEMYSRLLEVITRHIESILGADMLDLLMRETIFRLSKPGRAVLKEYLLITTQIDGV